MRRTGRRAYHPFGHGASMPLASSLPIGLLAGGVLFTVALIGLLTRRCARNLATRQVE